MTAAGLGPQLALAINGALVLLYAPLLWFVTPSVISTETGSAGPLPTGCRAGINE